MANILTKSYLKLLLILFVSSCVMKPTEEVISDGSGNRNGDFASQVPYISRATANEYIQSGSIQFYIQFPEDVSNVDDSDFSVDAPALTHSLDSVTYVSDDYYLIDISVSGGDGSITVNFADNDNSVTTISGDPLDFKSHSGDEFYQLDNTAPVVSVSALNNINSLNSTNYSFSGTCTEMNGTVNYDVSGISGLISGSIVCNGASWSELGVDVSSLGEGGFTITANLSDAAGNNAPVANNSALKDIFGPSITSIISGSPGDGTYANPQVIDILVNFNENVTTSSSSLTLDTGASAIYFSGSGSNSLVYRSTVADGQRSADLNVSGVTIGDAVDGSSNPIDTTIPVGKNLADNQAIIIDTVEPTISSITSLSPGDGTYTTGQVIDIIVTFNENVTTSTSSLLLGTTPSRPANYQSGSGSSAIVYRYTVGTGDISSDLDVRAMAVGDATDSAGNAVDVSLPAANNLEDNQAIIIDAQAPSVLTINRGAVPAANPTNSTVVEFDVTFSENVVSVVTSDFSATNSGSGGIPTITGITGGPSVWTVSVNTSGIEGDVGLNLNDIDNTITDVVGNPVSPNTHVSDQLWTVDTVVPTVTVTVFPLITNLNESSYTVGGTCSENGESVSYDVGGVSGTAAICSNGFWTGASLDVSGLPDGIVIVIADHIDAAGNNATQASEIATKNTGIVSVVEVSSRTGDGHYKAGETVNIEVDFTESVTVTGTPLLLLDTGEQVNYFSGSPGTTLNFIYTVQVGDNSTDLDYANTTALSLNGGTIQGTTTATNADLVLAAPGAANSISDDLDIVIDTIVPTIDSIVRADPILVDDTNANFTITFSEDLLIDPVIGDFQLQDASSGVSGSIESPVASSVKEYDVEVTGIAGSGTIELILNDLDTTLTDLAGNQLSASFYDSGEIYNVNHTPILDSILDFSVNEGVAITSINIGVSGEDTDIDGDALIYSCEYDRIIDASVTGGSLCNGGNLGGTFSFNSSTGFLDWTPDFDDDGHFEFKITADDQRGETNSQDDEIFVITVNNTDRAPVLAAISSTTVNEGDSIGTINANDGGDDFDADGDTIVYDCWVDIVIDGAVSSPVSCTTVGVAFDITTGVFNWSPNQQAFNDGDASGRYEFKVIADEGDLQDEEIFVITVSPIDVAPVLIASSDDGIATVHSVFFPILINDSLSGIDEDGDGEVINYSCRWDSIDNDAFDSPGHADCDVNGFDFNEISGNISGTPEVLVAGIYEFEIIGDASPGASSAPIYVTIKVEDPLQFVEIYSGLDGDSSCAIASDRKAYCWGRGVEGQLGHNSFTNEQSPVAVANNFMGLDETFTKLSLGLNHVCGLTNMKNTYCWGADFDEQLGDGTGSTNRSTPTPIVTTNLSAGEVFVDISSGSNHTCALSSLGNTFCWGNGVRGQLGHGGRTGAGLPSLIDSTTLSGKKFKNIYSGAEFSCGITGQGIAYCWGADDSGKLGNGEATTADQLTPAAISLGGRSPSEIFTSLSLGYFHACGLSNLGNAYCWGEDNVGQLGNGSTLGPMDAPNIVDTSFIGSGYKLTDIYVGGSFSCAHGSDGKSFCWGDNGRGQLGKGDIGGTLDRPGLTSELKVSTGGQFKKLALGGLYGCGIRDDGNTYCWGNDSSSQLGNGVLSIDFSSPVSVDPNGLSNIELFNSISLGQDHSLGLTNKGKLFSWGGDSFGKLGNGLGNTNLGVATAVDVSNLDNDERFIAVAAGGTHSCGITSLKRAYCWGEGSSGQIGDSTFNSQQDIPTEVDKSNFLNSNEGFVQVDTGYAFSCGVSNYGNTYCWGDGAGNKLGNGTDNNNYSIPVLVSYDNLNPVNDRFIMVTLGANHGCGLTSSGNVYCWGSNALKQVGDGGVTGRSKPRLVDNSNLNANEVFKKIDAGDSHTCGVTTLGNAYCWGSDGNGQSGDGLLGGINSIPVVIDTSSMNSNESLINISSGVDHSCGLSSEGNAYCWGAGGNGQLGIGSPVTTGKPSLPVDFASLGIAERLISISAGDNYSCGVGSVGNTYCWGADFSGQLGNGGADQNRTRPVLIDDSNI